MENNFQETLDKIMTEEGVLGVACNNAEGALLGARGVASDTAPGLITSIVQLSRQLSKSGEASPLVCIESSDYNVMLYQTRGVYFAVFRRKS
ncbi:putative ragulator complex protein LAMTOR5 [Paratrimastix pyriformis]|uniref:Late endosomal/lysosomal adaptor and MAPK and MTOR activator 5 n=1 Tax=Paratrimastix pyriformis TaxID=342808 RepID=A0ABQ8UMV4_9EUKA|nr:putative ragulator complex protein LAMTOR5 [Paratrimastix pyriformis]